MPHVLLLGGPLRNSPRQIIASNAIFRVASCLYILYDITYSIWLPNSTHSHSYVTFHFIAAFLTSDWLTSDSLVIHSYPHKIASLWGLIPCQVFHFVTLHVLQLYWAIWSGLMWNNQWRTVNYFAKYSLHAPSWDLFHLLSFKTWYVSCDSPSLTCSSAHLTFTVLLFAFNSNYHSMAPIQTLVMSIVKQHFIFEPNKYIVDFWIRRALLSLPGARTRTCCRPEGGRGGTSYDERCNE